MRIGLSHPGVSLDVPSVLADGAKERLGPLVDDGGFGCELHCMGMSTRQAHVQSRASHDTQTNKVGLYEFL